MNDESKRIMPLVSLNLFSKKSGRVITLYFAVSSRSGRAIIIQDNIIPDKHPKTVQSSNNPKINAAPGRPRISQEDSPEARSDNAITVGPNFCPPKAKSFKFFVFLEE